MTPGHRLEGRGAALTWLLGAAVSLALALAAWLDVQPVPRLEHLAHDALLRGTAAGTPSADTVVVDIDDESLAALGQWPWPRYRIADLLQRVAAQRPKAIALDMLLPEADRVSLAQVRQAFKRDFDIDVEIGGVPPALLDNDGFMGATMAKADVIGARYFYFDHATRDDAAPRPGIGIDGRTELLSLHAATGVLGSTEAIASQTRWSGFLNVRADDDGVLRRMPLLISHDGVVHGSLALVAAMRTLGASAATVETDRDGLALRIGAHRVPIDERGVALLRFDGPASAYPSVPALALMDGSLAEGTLAGKVVFIGSSAYGLQDVHVTPMEPRFPGLKTHAVMAQNILSDSHLRVPSWAPGAIGASCVLAGLLLTALFVGGARTTVLLGATVLAAEALVLSHLWLAAGAGLLVSAVTPLLLLAGLFCTFFTLRFARQRRLALRWRQQLEDARQVTIESMAAVAETRDPETGAHIKRTQHYVRAVAMQLRRTSERHAPMLTDEYIELLFMSAPLHDIGKVGIPDHILLKPGRLTPQEMDVMKLHAEFGRKIVHSASARLGGENFLRVAGEIAATHHERWDGNGYPLGLSGQAIPLSGRIMAVADVYDALISRRCYKEPFSHAHSLHLMRRMDGGNFDPEVFAAFCAIESEIIDIAHRFQDEAEVQGATPSARRSRPASSEQPGVRSQNTSTLKRVDARFET